MIDEQHAPVTTIYASNFRDVSATLRHIADQIDAGEWGVITDAALVLRAGRCEVFGFGPKAQASRSIATLEAGKAMLVRSIEDGFDG